MRHFTLGDFDFALPPELIAQHPATQRSASRLLDGTSSPPVDRIFRELPALLQPGDLLVFNDTQVLKARLFGEKPTGGRLELLVERVLAGHEVVAHMKVSKKPPVGAALAILLVVVIYRVWRPTALWLILRDGMRESVMILMIIGASILFGYMLSLLYVTQSVAEWIGALDVNRWVLMGWINVLLLVAGCFLPPAAVILMTTPILMPIITTAGFDPVWFGVILTVNMELGLITPPVGLNLYVINGIAPDVDLRTILRGAVPFMVCMIVAILLLCLFPEIATWLPDRLMGQG